MHVAREVYEKMVNGDSIADDQLEEALDFFRKLSDSLRVVGPVFQLAADEANRTYEKLYGYWASRKRAALSR